MPPTQPTPREAPARLADVLLAKDMLAGLCETEAIAYHPLDGFGRA